MTQREAGGVQWPAIFLLLAVVVGLGAWNYSSNLEAEEAALEQRRFSDYSDEGLQALAASYRSEIETIGQVYQARYQSRAKARDTAGVQAGVREFERVQRSSHHLRDLNGQIAQLEGMLREVEKEIAYRKKPAWSGAMVHLTRLLPRLGD